MDSVLIISNMDKATGFFADTLKPVSVEHIVTVSNCGEARRLLAQRDFDLVIINAPLSDETGENLSRHISSNLMSQVILVVKSEFFDAITANCQGDGVLTVSKPINKAVFWSALMLAKSAGNRIKRMRSENEALKQKIEDIRIVDRAKMILVSCMEMTENEAHRYIEKQAMNQRTSKRMVAESIINAE